MPEEGTMAEKTEAELWDAIEYAEGQLRGVNVPQAQVKAAHRRLDDLVERRDALAQQDQESSGVGEGRAVELLRKVTAHPRKIHPGRPAVQYGSVWQEIADEVAAFLAATPEPQQEEDGGADEVREKARAAAYSAIRATAKRRKHHTPEPDGATMTVFADAAARAVMAQQTASAETQRDQLLKRIETLRHSTQEQPEWKGVALKALFDLADSMQPATSPPVLSEQGMKPIHDVLGQEIRSGAKVIAANCCEEEGVGTVGEIHWPERDGDPADVWVDWPKTGPNSHGAIPADDHFDADTLQLASEQGEAGK